MVMLAMLVALIGAGVVSASAGKKTKQGLLENETLLAYASTSGSGGNSGRIWSAEGTIEGIGKAEVLVSASWNWSFYNGDHPAALVNSSTVDFDGCRTGKVCAAGTDYSGSADLTQGVVPGPLTDDYANGKVRRGHPDGFRTDATVTITNGEGDEIHGDIVGGSVTEIAVPGTGGGGSINEWFISFDIDGGTGEFAPATGSGYVHMVFDSGSAHTELPAVYQNNPDRFLEHEIFLNLD